MHDVDTQSMENMNIITWNICKILSFFLYWPAGLIPWSFLCITHINIADSTYIFIKIFTSIVIL